MQTPARRATNTGEAKSRPPDAKEWQDVIGRIAVKGLANLYVSWLLGDIEDELSPRERESILLTDEDIDEMSAPLAGFAAKSKFLQKRGRTIISLADSWEALVAMAIWARRVRKIARKHYAARIPEPPQQVMQPQQIIPATPIGPVNGEVNGNARSNDGPWQPPLPEGFAVFNPGAG